MPPTPPRDRRRLRPEQRRAQLLRAALHLAADRDLERVSTADIAAAAGVSEGLLFHYFPTKHHLIVAAVQHAAERLIGTLRSVSGRTPLEQLLAALDAYLSHVQSDPASWAVLLRTSDDPAILAIHDAVEQTSIELLCRTLGTVTLPPPLRLAVGGWLRFEQAISARWLHDPSLPRGQVVALLAGAFLGAAQAVAASNAECARLLQPLLHPDPAADS